MNLERFPRGHRILRTPCIWHPDRSVPRDQWAAVLFRRRFVLRQAVRGVRLWVTAAQRYELLLDGRLISRGPPRSDPSRWGCVRVALGRLGPGPHVLAARVWHFGTYAGIGQLGGRAFFLLCAEGAGASGLDLETGPAWRCAWDRSRAPLPRGAWGGRRRYCAVGAGERVRGDLVPWGWEQIDFDDSEWPAAAVVCRAAEDPWGNLPAGHILRPAALPPMAESPAEFARVAEAPEALRPRAERWLAGGGALVVPAQVRVRLVLDRGELTNAYPVLTCSGGAGARVRLVSAEAPCDPKTGRKSNRDETAGKRIFGHLDEFLPDGGTGRAFTTRWFRSFRYLELTVRTAARPLRLDGIRCTATGYPLRCRGRFRAGGGHRAAFDRLWEVSLRTARLCAHETFFDCPHYEQAQFPGDTRVQAVYHYLVANDDRLARKAIDDFHASRLPEGLTQCRYPSRQVQIIPTFSLYWIGMLHDFLVFRGDADFLGPYLDLAREVLGWFRRRLREDGMLGFVEYAPFIDWTPAFRCGNAPQDARGGSAILTMLLATACRWQADLEAACGHPQAAPQWRRDARGLAEAALRACWDPKRRLLADTASRQSFSLHAQVQAALAGAWPARQARAVLRRALDDPEVAPPGTLYFRYYVAAALRRCGLGGHLFGLLNCWHRCLDGTGLTTWPESDRDPRSDCHAWSVTPAIECLRTILGVEPASCGFAGFHFAPTLGPLPAASGQVPTPHGPVRVRLRRRDDGRIDAELATPVPALVVSQNRRLRPGTHRIRGLRL